jgi:hypothetical protein
VGLNWDLEDYISQSKGLGAIEATESCHWANMAKAVLQQCAHDPGVSFRLVEDEQVHPEPVLTWADTEAGRSNKDKQERTEKGAYFLACKVVEEFMGFIPYYRAEKGERFDILLRKKGSGLGGVADPYNFLKFDSESGKSRRSRSGAPDPYNFLKFDAGSGLGDLAPIEGARLEVGGTTSRARASGTLNQKIAQMQTERSDATGYWPAIAVVVDFETPRALINQRHGNT